MHVFLNELRVDDYGVGIYFCKDRQIKKSKQGKEFISMILSDRSGTIDTKIWEADIHRNNFAKGDYVKVEYRVKDFQGKRQMDVSRIRTAHEDEYDLSDYIRTSKYSLEELKQRLKYFLYLMDNEYSKRLVDIILDDEELSNKFYTHTAAKSIHHNYSRGLLEHTLGIMGLCEYFANNYGANLNIMLPACIYHDLGKIFEITLPPESEYTNEGQLIGHVMISYEILTENIKKIEDFPKDLAMNIKHCVLAHHGKLEYGAPKVPSTLEAMAVHLADYSDSRLVALNTQLDELSSNEEKTNFSKLFDTILFKTKI